MRKLLLAFVFVPACLFAQRNDSTHSRRNAPVFILKWSPLHLMVNHYPTIQIAAEYRITDYTSIQIDGGAIIDMDYDEEGTIREDYDMRGFKLKAEVRYYLTRINGGWRYYIAPELFYNHVDYSKADTYGFNCESGDCDYYRFSHYKMEYRESGLNIKIGGMGTFGRFCIDYHVGLAARFIRYTPVGRPAGETISFEDEHNWFDLTSEESRNTVQPTTGFRVGFVLAR